MCVFPIFILFQKLLFVCLKVPEWLNRRRAKKRIIKSRRRERVLSYKRKKAKLKAKKKRNKEKEKRRKEREKSQKRSSRYEENDLTGADNQGYTQDSSHEQAHNGHVPNGRISEPVQDESRSKRRNRIADTDTVISDTEAQESLVANDNHENNEQNNNSSERRRKKKKKKHKRYHRIVIHKEKLKGI